MISFSAISSVFILLFALVAVKKMHAYRNRREEFQIANFMILSLAAPSIAQGSHLVPKPSGCGSSLSPSYDSSCRNLLSTVITRFEDAHGPILLSSSNESLECFAQVARRLICLRTFAISEIVPLQRNCPFHFSQSILPVHSSTLST